MKPTPKGWPRISSAIYYDDAAKAIDWLCDVFGFSVRLKVEGDGGRVMHSELTYGDGLIMCANAGGRADRPLWPKGVSPATAGGNTQALMLIVDDADAHCAHARAKGARIVDEPSIHDYGEEHWADKSYGVLDCEGHMWWITQRMRDQPEK
jgi:uncharacterized glyoxalase superfamily protein PhnB